MRDERERFKDPRNSLVEARRWASNAAGQAEGDEDSRETAAIWAQIAVAHALVGLASAVLSLSDQQGGAAR